ncbi:MAG: hypothetical protein LCH99_01935 [Proteobacteria bacterium]|nr:hypothetical protein [Pseudomonadota bacterium]
MADDKTPEKKAYAVLSPLKHDGKFYEPAEGKVVKVSLTDEEADALKALGIIGEVPAKAAKSDNTGDGGGKPQS